jgi:uncharacterized cupin superfamily protein
VDCPPSPAGARLRSCLDSAAAHGINLTTPDGTFSVGVWEAQPYAERIDSYFGDEFCYVIRGQVTLIGKDGSAQTFVQGDSFTMEAGWAGEWRVDKPFLKYFALSTPRK